MATKARFESLELTMNELQQSVQMMCQNMEEMRSVLSAPRNENKKETRGSHKNPFAATKDDYVEDEDGEDETSDSDSSQDSSQKNQRWRNPIRMDFPKYNGSEDPRVWLDRARQYFRAQETPTKKKVQWASYHLDGEANQWWQWFDSRHNRITWTRFEKGLLQRFGTSELEEADEAIIRLKQTGSFRSYLSEFERLVNCVPHWRDKALLGAFMAGLRDDLAKEIRFFRPQSLEHAIELARHADDQAKNKRSIFHKIQPKATTTPSASGSMSRPQTSTGQPQAKRLSWAEMQAKREKNQCFNCDEPFSRGHTCKFARALLIEIDDEEEDTPPVYDKELDAATPAISLNALMGESRGKSMRMTGDLNGEILQLLIDSGSSLNFIHPRRAEELQLPVTHIPQIFVRVANGERMPCSIRFEAVPITIQGITFQTDLYGLSICNLDVVLGLPWLENLGPVLTDYKAMTMEFEWKGSKQNLQGNAPPTTVSAAKWADLAEGASYGTTVFVLMKSTTTETASKETPPEIQNLIERFADIMKEPKGLPPSRACDHKIALKDERTVINVAPYRYARYQKDEIERQVKDMLETGLIRPSLSPFSSPALLVKKKDGSWRFCVDYRALNDATVKDRFPIPTIDDRLDELHGAKYFSKMDLRAGFHQIRMDATDISKTAFRVHNGHYEYMVMPFGLCNAPSTFQAAMNNLFRKYLRKFVLVFFDDILVYSKDWKDHLQHLEIVFYILRENQFHLKYSKCAFGQTELEYLGHYISEQGVRVDDRKIEAMLTWPVPRNITHLRGFLGLTGYYRRFVRDYGKIASPLTKLLRKGSFVWNLEAEEAFKKLKEAMTTTPVLALPNFDEEFIVETDACGYGIGAVLMQGKRPIAYLSKGLSEKQRMRSTYEKEMLAILEAVRVWRPYLLGRHFKIITDQRSLRYLLEQKISTPEQQKWLIKLLGYDYEITYRSGKENGAADSLSRREDMAELSAISVPQTSLWSEIRRISVKDEEHCQLMKDVEKGVIIDPQLTISRGYLLRGGKVVVPKNEELRRMIISEFHDSNIGGHSGVLRTYSRLTQVFYWRGMKAAVLRYVQQCDVCQRNKADTRMPSGLLEPLKIPDVIWADISMDFVEGLPRSAGKDVVMVVVDRLSKYSHFIALSHPFTAKSVAEAFIRQVVRLHGVPQSIVSDRDKIFMSHFWQELFRRMGTKLCMSSAYHPETDGQTEVTNRSLEQYLRCFVASRPRMWESYLAWAEFWYNTTFHRAIKMTPFEAVYGRPPPVVVPYETGSSLVQEIDVVLRARDEVLKELKVNLELARQQQKVQADKGRRAEEFEVGDWVYLRLRPYHQQTIFRRAHQKLASKFYGPFKILRRIGSVAYELELPQTSRIHPVFHVSLLRRRMGNEVVHATPLPPLSEQGRPVVEPEEVLAARSILHNGKDQEQVLVKWRHLSAEDATWEAVAELRSRFPQILLGDKSVLEDGRDDESQKLSTELRPIPNEEALRRGTRVRKPSWKLRGAA